jgi:FtsP/CotA-like multicopper oxidase with cupredoxin domain
MKKMMTLTGVTAAALLWGAGHSYAEKHAATAAAPAAAPPQSLVYVSPPQLVPGVNYDIPNYANSPILTKFKDSLPGLTAGGAAVPGFYSGANNLGLSIPVGVAMSTNIGATPPPAGVPTDGAYYEIALLDYTNQMHSDLGMTLLRGYVQIEPPGSATTPIGSLHVALTYPDGSPLLLNGVQLYGYDKPSYLGPVIVATQGVPTRIKFYNLLPAGAAGDLFLPMDLSFPGAGLGPDGATLYSQNRATLHLHGGDNPWVSDGTALQWATPANETNPYKKGASQQNVPDMPDPGQGAITFYWPNGESGRLMFYHDHAQGATRLNPYAGEAAGYLLVDPTEMALNSFAPGGEIPVVIQDRAFVNDGTVPATFPAGAVAPAPTTTTDPLWASNPKWGQTKGSLWWPHVYMPNQNPNDISGANPMGRWDYGAWFWPIFPSGVPPQVSAVPETFVDTPIVNGTAYPYLNVQPTTYRMRILNAANDRYFNLQMYVATSTTNAIVGSISLTSAGGGYTVPPQVVITPAAGDTKGKGASAVAEIDTDVTSPTVGQVTNIFLTSPGSGYTAAPSVTIVEAFGDVPTSAATALAAIYTAPTEVGMIPADKVSPALWPTWWTANDTPGMIPNILDGRMGGVPDPRYMGPSFIHIGSEGGLSPTAVELKNTPIGYEQNKRSVTVLNTWDHTLFLGPAERADVLVDFSKFAGKTIIVYNDSPAPVPAGDPRNDFYTFDPDNTGQGGAPTTLPGFGPNTRTIMQINVAAAAPAPALNLTALNTAVATAYGATQPAAIVPAATYARISDTSMTLPAPLGTVPLQPKTIQELFDPLGRMNSTLGVEIPFTTATIQTTIPYGFLEPATEVMPDGVTQLWKITHNGVDTHVIHFHLFNVQVINRVGWDGAIKPPFPEEMGWKETVKMNPLEDIVVAMRIKVPTVPFSQPNNIRTLDPNIATNATTYLQNGYTVPAFSGVDPNGNPVVGGISNLVANFGYEYTWHCHILGHEENDMMRATCVAVAPGAPTGPTATVNGTGTSRTVALTWANSTPQLTTGFIIQRSASATFASGIVSNRVGNVTTFTDPIGNTALPLYYRVTAVNAVGSGVAGFPMATAASAFSATATAAPPAAVAIGLVQSSSSQNANNATVRTLTSALPGNVTAGNLIVVAVSGWPKLPNGNPTDSRGNTYTRVGNVRVTSAGGWSALYYAQNARAGATTVTVRAQDTGGQMSMIVAEFSNVATTGALDRSAGNTGNSRTPSSGNMTPTVAGDLVIGAGNHEVTTVTSPGTGFTMVRKLEDDSTHEPLAMEYQVLTGTQTTSANFSLSPAFPAAPWGQVGAMFKHN